MPMPPLYLQVANEAHKAHVGPLAKKSKVVAEPAAAADDGQESSDEEMEPNFVLPPDLVVYSVRIVVVF